MRVIPQALQDSGWAGALSYHEAGHAVMMLRHQRPFRCIDMTPDPGRYWAAVLSDSFELASQEQCLTEMKVAAAGVAARACGGTLGRYRPMSDAQITGWLSGVAAADPCDEGAFRLAAVALGDLRVAAGQLACDAAGLIRVFRAAEAEITGPLWPAVEALAVLLLGACRAGGEVGYDEALAAALPLIEATA